MMTEQQTAELIELRKADMGIVPLARKFGIGVDKVRAILVANGVSTQTIYQRIAWCIKANPEWSDSRVATHCECHDAIVEERRQVIQKNRKQSEASVGITLNERVDRGPGYRVCCKWMRANCSWGERNLSQIKAMFEVKNFPITLAEVRASCAAAGLAVDTHGNVTAPMREGVA